MRRGAPPGGRGGAGDRLAPGWPPTPQRSRRRRALFQRQRVVGAPVPVVGRFQRRERARERGADDAARGRCSGRRRSSRRVEGEGAISDTSTASMQALPVPVQVRLNSSRHTSAVFSVASSAVRSRWPMTRCELDARDRSSPGWWTMVALRNTGDGRGAGDARARGVVDLEVDGHAIGHSPCALRGDGDRDLGSAPWWPGARSSETPPVFRSTVTRWPRCPVAASSARSAVSKACDACAVRSEARGCDHTAGAFSRRGSGRRGLGRVRKARLPHGRLACARRARRRRRPSRCRGPSPQAVSPRRQLSSRGAVMRTDVALRDGDRRGDAGEGAARGRGAVEVRRLWTAHGAATAEDDARGRRAAVERHRGQCDVGPAAIGEQANAVQATEVRAHGGR